MRDALGLFACVTRVMLGKEIIPVAHTVCGFADLVAPEAAMCAYMNPGMGLASQGAVMFASLGASTDSIGVPSATSSMVLPPLASGMCKS